MRSGGNNYNYFPVSIISLFNKKKCAQPLFPLISMTDTTAKNMGSEIEYLCPSNHIMLHQTDQYLAGHNVDEAQRYHYYQLQSSLQR